MVLRSISYTGSSKVDARCVVGTDPSISQVMSAITEIEKLDDPVVFCAMKRGDNIPEDAPTKHGTSTLIPYSGVKAGGIGIEQYLRSKLRGVLPGNQ